MYIAAIMFSMIFIGIPAIIYFIKKSVAIMSIQGELKLARHMSDTTKIQQLEQQLRLSKWKIARDIFIFIIIDIFAVILVYAFI